MSVRAASVSCTRIGTSRSPVSNFASAGPTSPMVATRIVSASASVETPRRTAKSMRGMIRSSGRSNDVSAMTLETSGIRRIWFASSAATLATVVASAPTTTSEIARNPFSSTNQ
jgi:hypothetical protein